jgi:hypothetical protein
MAKGRPNKYYTHVKPRFEEIKEWLKAGATDKEIAENLGVNPKVFCKYKSEFNDLNELCKNGRLKAVQEIKAALFKRATGFTYKEKKVIRKKILLKDDDDADVPATVVQTEDYEKYALPDPASAMILLKHWDKEADGSAKWTQDPAMLELKKKEFELKKEHIESGEWT